MKLSLLFILLFGLNASAQRNYFIEYNTSVKKGLTDSYTLGDLILDNSFSFGAKMNKVNFSMGVGREDWFLHYFDTKYYSNTSLNTAHCRTYKMSALLDYQFSIPKTKLSIRVGGGAKVYFLNQMKDSLSLTAGDHSLRSLKPSVLLNAKDTYSEPFQDIGLANYSFITSVPYALTTNLAVQYNFKKCALKFYFEPYWMMIKRKNAKHFTPGSYFGFYTNIGLGINYPLNFKKKEKTSPINQ
jgi:hypothetical protein